LELVEKYLYPRTKSSVRINTDRFYLKILEPNDVSQDYLNWFTDETVLRYIVSAKDSQTIDELRTYVADKYNRSDCLLFGIYTHDTDEHIGNIKFEPIDLTERYATMGILIGSPTWRNRGVGAEVLRYVSVWLRDKLELNKILLGVEKQNVAAIRSYEKAGFVQQSTPFLQPHPNYGISMVLHLVDEIS
jgi:RimJ/RimL family protein N-acetyltransferase